MACPLTCYGIIWLVAASGKEVANDMKISVEITLEELLAVVLTLAAAIRVFSR